MTDKREGVNNSAEISREEIPRILLPISGYEISQGLEQATRIASELVRDQGSPKDCLEPPGELAILNLISPPNEETSDQEAIEEEFLQKASKVANQLAELSEEAGIRAKESVTVTSDAIASVHKETAAKHYSGIFAPIQGGDTNQEPLLNSQTAVELDAEAEPNVFIHKLPPAARTVDRILLMVGGGPHSILATEAARACARATDATVDVTHIYSEEESVDMSKATAILQSAEESLKEIELFETGLLPSDHAAETIVERSQRYDLAVFGSPTAPPLRRLAYSNLANESKSQQTQTAVLTARKELGSQ